MSNSRRKWALNLNGSRLSTKDLGNSSLLRRCLPGDNACGMPRCAGVAARPSTSSLPGCPPSLLFAGIRSAHGDPELESGEWTRRQTLLEAGSRCRSRVLSQVRRQASQLSQLQALSKALSRSLANPSQRPAASCAPLPTCLPTRQPLVTPSHHARGLLGDRRASRGAGLASYRSASASCLTRNGQRRLFFLFFFNRSKFQASSTKGGRQPPARGAIKKS